MFGCKVCLSYNDKDGKKSDLKIMRVSRLNKQIGWQYTIIKGNFNLDQSAVNLIVGWNQLIALINSFSDSSLPYRGKKVREKWLNFSQVTKFFPDFLFPDQYFSPIFFHLTKNLSRFILIISHLFEKFIITTFFDVL